MVPVLREFSGREAYEQVDKLRSHGWLQLKLGEASDWLAGKVNSLLTALGRAPAFKVHEVELRKIMRKMIMHPANATIQVEACMALNQLSINATAKVTIAAAGGIHHVLSAMTGHSGDADVQYAALRTLSSLALGNKHNAKQIAEAGNINTVLGVMLRHRDVADVQYFACDILKQVSDNDNADRIIKSGGIGMVVAAVGGHAQHSAVQEVAMETLWHLTTVGSSRTLSDDVGSIIAAMRSHAAHRGMQHFACTVLSSLAAHENDRVRIERDGGIESLLQVMEAHPADAQLQQLVCQILGQLTLHADGLRKMTSSNVLPQQLVSVLKLHGADANIAGAACALLQTLALGPTLQAQLRSVAGVEELLRVAKLHRQEAALQQTACGALVHLAADSDILAHVDNLAENLLEAMWAHPKVLPVQAVAAHGLARVVLHEGLVPKIKEGNGIEAILRAMIMHAGDAVLQEHLCAVLCRLASDPDCQWKIVADGGLQHIICAMDAGPLGAAKMQARACAALHTLSSHPDNQIAIGTAGGIEVLVKVLAQHRDVGEVQFWGVMNLEQLARIPDNRVKILAANGITSIVRAMDAHRSDTELQYSACEVLRRLAETAEGQAQIVAAGGIASIVAAMEAHSAAASLQVSACGALWTLAEESMGNAQSILEAGGADSLAGSMDIHVGNPEIQAQAARTLWYLARQRPRSMARTDRRARNWKARRLVQASEREWALRTNGGLPSVVTWYPRLRAVGGLPAAVSRGFDDNIDSLLLAMAMHKEPAVQYFSLCALGAIAAYDDDAAHAIIKSGGIAKIACAMAENENRAEMQWRGEEALWNLADADCREMAASAHFSSSSGRACALRLADGLQDVFHVMEKHRWVRNIQAFASWTLLTLATNEGRASAEVCECEAACAIATREGEAAAEEERNAANVKAAALAVAKSAAEMERAAAEAKAQATTEAAASAAAMELRAAADARAIAETAAAAAARGESSAAAAREQAEHAVYTLTNRQERVAGCIRIGGVGGIMRILEALECWDYHGDTEMLNGMLTCLQLIARNPDYAQQIAAVGGIERVLSLMDKYTEEPGILMAASLSLTTLAGHMEPDSSKPERFHPYGDLYVAHGDNAQKIRAEQGLEKIDALIRTCHEQHALHTEPPWNLLGKYGYLVKASVCQEDDADAECTAMGVRLTTA